MTMAQIDATSKSEAKREVLSPEDGRARQHLVSWAREQGFTVSIDPIGNLYMHRASTESTAAPVLRGSHLDSWPTGGNLTECRV